MGPESYETRPFQKIRHAYLDVLAAGKRKNMIHGLVEVDVTEARERLHQAAGEHLSFTAFVIHAVAQAVAADRIMHAYRRHNRLILFDDVDVNTQIETEIDGQKEVQSFIVRAANTKSVRAISEELRAARDSDPGAARRYRGTLAYLNVPRPVRRQLWRVAMANPRWFKRFGGTIGLSSVGMFGPGGGWGIPIAPPTLMITVGGIAKRARYRDGFLEPREVLDLTISVDHDIVDGAPAARFAHRLTELIEGAAGLEEPRGSEEGGRS